MVQLLIPKSWESKSSLLTGLNAHNERTVLLGRGAEAPRKFCSFSVNADTGRAEVGVIASGLGGGAAAALLQGERYLLVGHDLQVSCIELKSLTVVSSLPLGGTFYEFIPLDSDDEIVVVHELGMLRVDARGAVKWSLDTDIIEDAAFDRRENIVVLKLLDAPPCVVALDSGECR